MLAYDPRVMRIEPGSEQPVSNEGGPKGLSTDPHNISGEEGKNRPSPHALFSLKAPEFSPSSPAVRTA